MPPETKVWISVDHCIFMALALSKGCSSRFWISLLINKNHFVFLCLIFAWNMYILILAEKSSRNNSGSFFWYKISSHMLSEIIHLWCWSCSTYIKGLCIKGMLFCILMFNNLLIMTDRYTELTCSGVVSDLFQNNSGNSENLAATVFLLITEKCLLGLIAFPLRFFTGED